MSVGGSEGRAENVRAHLPYEQKQLVEAEHDVCARN